MRMNKEVMGITRSNNTSFSGNWKFKLDKTKLIIFVLGLVLSAALWGGTITANLAEISRWKDISEERDFQRDKAQTQIQVDLKLLQRDIDSIKVSMQRIVKLLEKKRL